VGEGDHLQGPGVDQVSHQNFLDLNNLEQDQTQNLRGKMGFLISRKDFVPRFPIKTGGQAVSVLCTPGSPYGTLVFYYTVYLFSV
jgi:hypothetical protein